MSRTLISAGLTAALLVLGLSPASFGHGGQYRGPGDTVPPNLGGGGDTTPPGNPGGPGTPGPGAPTTGGGRGPGTGGGPAAPAGSGPSGSRPTTGGPGGFQRRGGGEGYERWEFWWEHNKEPFLALKSRLGGDQVISESVGFLTGRGTQKATVSGNRPTASDVKAMIPEILPLLDETHPDVVDSAVLAVARMTLAEDADSVLASITKTVGHSATTGRESATLALGVLGSDKAIEDLRTLMLDTQEGRQLSGKPAGVESMVRAFAAASIGMIGHVEMFDTLTKVIDDQRLNSERDLKAMALLALGMMPENHGEIAGFLCEKMTDRNLDRIVRAQAPIALGKLVELHPESQEPRSFLEKVLNLFQDDKTDFDLGRSLAVCLGMIGRIEDTPVIDALIEAVNKSNDDQTRHFSIMALAQIGARDTEPAIHREAHEKLREFFLRELVKPRRITHQPYGALGLAVYARSEALKNQEPGIVLEAGGKILEMFGKTNNPSYQGAMAVGLGLLNFEEAKQPLWEEFEDSNDQPLQGYIALALGLLRDTAHANDMRNMIKTKGLDFKFRLQLARALGLMGDSEARDTLIDYLQTAETLSETSSSAQALGLIGDRSAIEPLLGIVKNRSKQPLQRGFACVALGIIAEKEDLPWNHRFSVNSNYRAKVPALSEILDIL